MISDIARLAEKIIKITKTNHLKGPLVGCSQELFLFWSLFVSFNTFSGIFYAKNLNVYNSDYGFDLMDYSFRSLMPSLPTTTEFYYKNTSTFYSDERFSFETDLKIQYFCR